MAKKLWFILAFLAFTVIAFQIVFARHDLVAEDPTPGLDEFAYAPLILKEWTPAPTASPTLPAIVRVTNILSLPDDDYYEEHVSLMNYGDESADITDWTLHGPADKVATFPPFTLGSHRTAAVWTERNRWVGESVLGPGKSHLEL